MMNNVFLVGRLTRDPELKVTQSNMPIVRFTLAVNRNFTNQAGEREADFVGCVAFNRQAENLAKFMRQGSLIGIEGRIQTGRYEADHGTVYTTDVIANSITFLESRSDRDSSGYEPQARTQQPKRQVEQNTNDEYYETSKNLVVEDDLPF